MMSEKYFICISVQTRGVKLLNLSKLRSLEGLDLKSIPHSFSDKMECSGVDSVGLKGECMNQHPQVYWLTGLSDSGKSTLCRKLVDYLRNLGTSVILLDGDEIRAVVGADQLHTREDRLALAMRYSRLCKLLSDQGFDVAIATISLFEEVHNWNREHIPGYCEIFLDVPIEELRRRDSKGIYGRYDRNEIKHVAGMDLQVDIPRNPDVWLRFSASMDEDAMFDELVRQLKELNRI